MNLHSKTSNRSTFVNIGLLVASLAMVTSYATGIKDANSGAIVSPFVAFGVSAMVAFIASRRASGGFDFIRDGGALPVFFMAYVASGNTRPWVYAMLALSLISILFLFISKRQSNYCEEDDIIDIKNL